MRDPCTLRRGGTSSLALFAALVAGPAWADCEATGAFSPRGFLCSGLDPDGISLPFLSGIGRIELGARVGGEVAVEVGTRATVINEGVIEAGRVGVVGADDLTVLNEGRIAGGQAAIEAGDFLVLRNEAGAVLEGGEVAVDVGKDPQIDNDGEIRGGISGEGFVTVRNGLGGVIANGLSSTFGVILDNTGLVEGGVVGDLDTDITNREAGVIRGRVEGGPGLNSILNEGLIDGDIYATQGLGVANLGTLLGSISSTDETVAQALLHGSVEGRFPPFPRGVQPTGWVTGMPSAV